MGKGTSTLLGNECMPLHNVVRLWWDMVIVRFFVEHGADVNHFDNYGVLPPLLSRESLGVSSPVE